MFIAKPHLEPGNGGRTRHSVRHNAATPLVTCSPARHGIVAHPMQLSANYRGYDMPGRGWTRNYSAPAASWSTASAHGRALPRRGRRRRDVLRDEQPSRHYLCNFPPGHGEAPGVAWNDQRRQSGDLTSRTSRTTCSSVSRCRRAMNPPGITSNSPQSPCSGEPDVGGRSAYTAGGRRRARRTSFHFRSAFWETPMMHHARRGTRSISTALRSSSDISLSFFRSRPGSARARLFFIWASWCRRRCGARIPELALQVPRADLRRRFDPPAARSSNIARHRASDESQRSRRPAIAAHRCFDEVLSCPTEFGARIAGERKEHPARRAHMTDVIDPLGGSYYVETLTDALEAEILRTLKVVADAQAGCTQQSPSRRGSAKIGESAWRFQDQVESGADRRRRQRYQVDEDRSARHIAARSRTRGRWTEAHIAARSTRGVSRKRPRRTPVATALASPRSRGERPPRKCLREVVATGDRMHA